MDLGLFRPDGPLVAYAGPHTYLVGLVVLTLIVIVLVVLRSTRRIVAKLEKADTAKEELRLHLFNAAKLASVGEMASEKKYGDRISCKCMKIVQSSDWY